VDVVRDLLDKQVVDRNGKPLGRVDTVIFDVPASGPPTVTAIEIGLVAVARRLHPALAAVARAVEAWAGVERGRPVRIPIARVLDFERDVKVDVTASETDALAFEQAARAIISKVPGA